MPRDESSTPDPTTLARAAAWLKTLPPPLVMRDRGPEGCWTTEERIARAAAREATAHAWQTAPPDVLRTLEVAGVVPPWRAALCPCPGSPVPGPDALEWTCPICGRELVATAERGWTGGPPRPIPPVGLRARLIAVAAELLLRDDPALDAVALCTMADEVGAVEAERDDLRNCPPRWLEPAGRGPGAAASGWREVEEFARRAMEPLRAEITAEQERQHQALLRLYGEAP